MKAQDYSERKLDVESWEVRLTTYRIGEVYYCHADNVSPGANIARATGASREEAERQALERATAHLSNTKRRAV